jgi:hypothetical protein
MSEWEVVVCGCQLSSLKSASHITCCVHKVHIPILIVRVEHVTGLNLSIITPEDHIRINIRGRSAEVEGDVRDKIVALSHFG